MEDVLFFFFGLFVLFSSVPSAAPHPEHDAMLDVEQDLLFLPVVPDEGVQRVAVRHPANQARVGGQRDDGVALDADGGEKRFLFMLMGHMLYQHD